MGRYWKSPEGLEELAELRGRFPSLILRQDTARGTPALCGILEVAQAISYTITLVLPPNYPRQVPTLFCDPAEIPRTADRHFFTDTGAACLCAMSEYRLHWPPGSRLLAFIERLVVPFLVSQFYFQTHGAWPPTGQRTHGPKGILEAYAEIAAPLGNSSISVIRDLMLCLARKREPCGHEPCPCGSRQILRRCHAQAVRQLRASIQFEHARADYRYLATLKFAPFHPLPPHF